MNQTINSPEENKKRAAFKRFSKMSAAGLAVLSLSAFTDVSEKQIMANVENKCDEKQQFRLSNFRPDKSFVFDSERFTYSDSDTTQYGDNTDEGEYGNSYSESQYTDITYSNHTDYSNNYSNNCE
jgi:hypothetical protein